MMRKNVREDGQTDKKQIDGRRRRTTTPRGIDEREREKKIAAQCYCRLRGRRIIAVNGEKKGESICAPLKMNDKL